MPGRPVIAGDYSWPSVQAAVAFMQGVLRTHRDQALEGEVLAQVLAILGLHPCWVEKQGPGVAAVRVLPIEYGVYGFWLDWVGGGGTDVSYRKALSSPTHRSEVLDAMRRAVAEQVYGYRRRAFASGPQRCALTGLELTEETCAVDHEAPRFADLAAAWLATVGGDGRVGLMASRVGQAGRSMLPEQERCWAAYHLEHARLRLLHRNANRLRR